MYGQRRAAFVVRTANIELNLEGRWGATAPGEPLRARRRHPLAGAINERGQRYASKKSLMTRAPKHGTP
jgi:hypothetical protein